jgi:hypothetical protein
VSPGFRERSDRLLGRLTWAIAVVSAAAAVVLAVVSAVTIPGSSDAAAAGTTADTSQTDPSGFLEDDPPALETNPQQSLQPVQALPQPVYGGGRHAGSGGSR